MSKLLKKNDGSPGVKVGNEIVYTYEGAIECYKLACKVCFSDMSNYDKSAINLNDIAEDVRNATGIDFEELEKIEIDVLNKLIMNNK